MLLYLGADPMILSCDGQRAADIAARRGKFVMQDILKNFSVERGRGEVGRGCQGGEWRRSNKYQRGLAGPSYLCPLLYQTRPEGGLLAEHTHCHWQQVEGQFLRRLEIFQADTNTPSIPVWTPPAPTLSTQADTTEFIDTVDGDTDRANAPEPDLTGPTTRSAARSDQQIPHTNWSPKKLPTLPLRSNLWATLSTCTTMTITTQVPSHVNLYHSLPSYTTSNPCHTLPGPTLWDLTDLPTSSSLPRHLEYLTTTHSEDWKQSPGDRFRPPVCCTSTWPP